MAVIAFIHTDLLIAGVTLHPILLGTVLGALN